MYDIYISNRNYTTGLIDELCIYSDSFNNEDVCLIDPKLDVETGVAGSLTFTFPPNNLYYDRVAMMTTEVFVKKNNNEVWRGRILNFNTDFFNQKNVDCEGELTYLNDTFQPQIEYTTQTLRQFIEAIINIHNQKVANFYELTDSQPDDWTTDNHWKDYYISSGEGINRRWTKITDENPPTWEANKYFKKTDSTTNYHEPKASEPFDKSFRVGAVFVNDDMSTNITYRNTDYETTLASLKKIADTYKGYFIVKHEIRNGVYDRYLDFIKDFTGVCSQSINFGENLLDYDQSFKMEDLCTVAMPIGAKMEDKAGDELYIYNTENDQNINYLGSNGQFGYDPLDDYRYAGVVYVNGDDFKSGDKIYVSVAQVEDSMTPVSKDGIWCFATSDGSVIEGTLKTWSGTPGSGQVETYEKHELTIPPGAHRLRVGGATRYKPDMKVYRSKAKERVDDYYTIAGVGDIDDGVTSHKSGDIYVINKALYEKYGWHEKKLSFGDLDSSQQLYDMTVSYLTTTQFEQMELKLTALDLSRFDVNYDDIWINMNVPIYSKPHGLTDNNFSLPCTKISINFNNPESNKYEFGYNTKNEITNTQASVTSDLSKLFSQVPTFSDTIVSARENAAMIMDSLASTGHVSFTRDANDPNQITEILISDAADPNQALKQWRWNQGGFAFRKRTSATDPWDEQDYTLAITMDGNIVANFIATGTMYADRIAGGTLTLGTIAAGTNIPGNIVVKNSSNNDIMTVDKEWGLTCNGSNAWSRIYDGRVVGGGYSMGNNDGFIVYQGTDHEMRVSGLINFDNLFDGYYGVDVRTKAFGINSDTIYVSDGFDGQAYVALSTHVEIGNKRLKFVKGMLWGVDDIQNGGV